MKNKNIIPAFKSAFKTGKPIKKKVEVPVKETVLPEIVTFDFMPDNYDGIFESEELIKQYEYTTGSIEIRTKEQ